MFQGCVRLLKDTQTQTLVRDRISRPEASIYRVEGVLSPSVKTPYEGVQRTPPYPTGSSNPWVTVVTTGWVNV